MRLSHLFKSSINKKPENEKGSETSVARSSAPGAPKYFSVGAQRLVRKASSDPMPACDSRSASSLVDHLKNTPPSKINFKAIEKALVGPELSAENRIWYGICLHMQNKRAHVILRDMNLPSIIPREVVVTTAVENILFGDSSSEQFSACIKTIEDYTKAHQDDRFARLLESLLIYHRDGTDSALPIVETLYLDYKTYSPCLSLMASYMFQQSAFAAATDFASEALSLDEDNYQARAVIAYQNILESKKPIKDAFAHASKFLHPESPDSILFCRYALIDPC